MSNDHEVKIKLKADDGASAVVKNLKGSFDHLGHGVDAVGKKIDHVVGGVGRTMIAASGLGALGGGLLSAGILEKGMEAAKAANAQEKTIAQTLAMTDRQGKSYEVLKAKAHGMRDEFVQLGIAGGVMADTVVETFNDIASRSGKSTSEVVKLTKNIIDAGRVVGDTETLTRGMRMLESGMVSARNPIIAIIRSTGLLRGNIHEVAQQMQKMTPEKQMEIGEKAIAKLAAKAKDIAPTFGMMANSMKQMGENILENIGQPVMKALMPVFQNVQKYILEHRKDIEHWAQVVGTKVGQWVKEAAHLFEQAFRWIQTHAEEIKNAISFAADAIRGAIEFMLAHKEVIVGMLTVKGLSSVGGGGAGLLGGSAAVGAMIGTQIGQAIVNAQAGGEKSARGNAVIAEATKAMQEMAEKGDKAGIRALYEEVLAKGKAEGLQSSMTSHGNTGVGTPEQFAKALNDAASVVYGRAMDVSAEKEQTRRVAANEDFKKKFQEATLESRMAEAQDKGSPERQAHDETAGKDLAGAYKIATEEGSAAGQEHVIAILTQSHALRRALVEGGEITGEGFDAMVAVIRKKSAEAANDLVKLDAEKKAATRGPSVTNVGGVTNHFNQNFRDSDPDRIMLAFVKHLDSQSISRRYSRVGSPFGL